MLSCNCLNVIIETETNDFLKVTLDVLKLTEDESKDVFFKQEIVQVGKLSKILKTYSELVSTRAVGSWLVHNCVNCGVHTHAIHKDRGAALVLVSSKLLTDVAISALSNSEEFSSTFKIIINYNPLDDNKAVCDYLSPDTEEVVNNLKQRASELIKQQAASIEEKIRLFTEQEYAALEEFRDKVLKEQKALIRVILNERLKSARTSDEPTSTNLETSSSESKKRAYKVDNVPEKALYDKSAAAKPKPILISKSPKTAKAGNVRHHVIKQTSSFDTEGLFPLEDMDDTKYSQSETDDTDNEESMKEEGGILINARSTNQLNIAKSLPMNIPAFMSPLHNHASHESDDLLPRNEDQLDIAASIKALAKSVHGDTVFGDLPRPRFSTHI